MSHANYLAHLVRSYGAETYSLSCPGSSNICYNKMYKGQDNLGFFACMGCRVGALTSSNFDNVSWIKSGASINEDIDKFLIASSATLHRNESQVSWTSDHELKNTRKILTQNFKNTFFSALRWIEGNKLDYVLVFNGRIDMTRAVCLACEKLKIPYITHERPWLGHGIQLIPNENCQSLLQRNLLVKKYDDVPLSALQACLASENLASRFLRTNRLEWSLYNLNSKKVSWPQVSSGEKVLVLPGSKSEVAGHHELATEWNTTIEALDRFIDVAKIKGRDLIVRGHPIWGKKVANRWAFDIDESYRNWAQKRGAIYISASDNADTYGLIEASDIVIVNGGSSAVEAGACGKKIVSLGPCVYQEAKFLTTLKNYKEINNFSGFDSWISGEDVIRYTMRYMYTSLKRFPQYTEYVRALSTKQYRYKDGANPERLMKIFSTSQLIADDENFCHDSSEEDRFISELKEFNWGGMKMSNEDANNEKYLNIPSGSIYKMIDSIY